MHGITHLDRPASMNNDARDYDDFHDLAAPTFLEAPMMDLQEGKDLISGWKLLMELRF